MKKGGGAERTSRTQKTIWEKEERASVSKAMQQQQPIETSSHGSGNAIYIH
jgi:hypothetical protein